MSQSNGRARPRAAAGPGEDAAGGFSREPRRPLGARPIRRSPIRRQPLRALWVAASAVSLGLVGCYQTLGAGYIDRFAEAGGSSFQGHYLVAFGDVVGDDEPAAFGKAEIAGGPWGMRAADVLGVMAQQDLGDVSFFLRPGLAFFVIGAEARGSDAALWLGLGAELEVGLMVPLGDDSAFEIGVHTGADLSYTGTGTGGFVGGFIGFGWTSDGPDLVTR